MSTNRLPDAHVGRSDWAVLGPSMWAELHRWAFRADLARARDWLDAFSAKIPCGECRVHWSGLLRRLPPDASSHDRLFRWTVDAHNAVNDRLGKPRLTLGEAIQRWRNGDVIRTRERVARSSRFAHTDVVVRTAPPRPAGAAKCVFAEPGGKPNRVSCKLGLYGGSPHVAVCVDCPSRQATEPRPGAAPSKPTTRSSIQKVEEVRSASAERLILRNFLSPGDVLMMTAAVRDLHRAHPGKYYTFVESSTPDLWEHNPYTGSGSSRPQGARIIEMQYPLIHHSNQRPSHFIQGYVEYLAAQLGVAIPITEFRGDVHLSDDEKGWTNQIEEEFGFRGPFWIVVAGGKHDFTAKWWAPECYQRVVDHFSGRVQFVQCGQQNHWHPALRGTFNLIGRTSTRQFVRLMYHASGVLCPVTFAMHLAAAVPTKQQRLRPCVVVAGGREPPHWEAYPGHQYLHTVGALPCCATGGCWKSRCQPMGDGDRKDRENLCERPVQVDSSLRIPQCMMLIQPKDVIRAIERSLAFGA